MDRAAKARGSVALMQLRALTDDLREWGVTVNSEERLMARARTWFADGQHTLNDLLLYLSLHGERENIVFWRDAHDDVFGMMTVTFFSHLVTDWKLDPLRARCFYAAIRCRPVRGMEQRNGQEERQ
ncbi:TPA: hypothetical protein P5S08_002472 [Salmonella enterica subsp. enterica serovar Concord]|nr:hypothetical protein [Salmonella enterica subsp. enterica serovar Concord]